EMRGQPLDPFVVVSGEIAHAGPLDLDDARAHVGKLTCAKRRRDGMFQANDGYAVKRTRAGRSLGRMRFIAVRSAGGCVLVHTANLNSAWCASVPSCSAQRRALPSSPNAPATWNGCGAISG